MSKVKRKWLAGTAVTVLVLLNTWRWWPSDAHALSIQPTVVPMLVPSDFRVHGLVPVDSEHGIARNLFVVSTPQPQVAELVPIVPAPAPPPSEPDAKSLLRSHLAEYQLEGTLARSGRMEAFLSRMNEQYHITQGDRLDDGTVVIRIEMERVVLRDSDGESHTLRLRQ